MGARLLFGLSKSTCRPPFRPLADCRLEGGGGEVQYVGRINKLFPYCLELRKINPWYFYLGREKNQCDDSITITYINYKTKTKTIGRISKIPSTGLEVLKTSFTDIIKKT